MQTITPVINRSLLLAAALLTTANAQPICDAGEALGVRIDYEASIPAAAIAMAPWSEVQRSFPGIGGITQRTVYVTRERLVDVQRGQGLRATFSKSVEVPAPGVHFRDESGREITWVGYAQVPLHTMRIQTRTERISYSSQTGQARRSAIGQRDSDITAVLLALDESSPVIGDREYAGVRCTAKRIPTQGPNTETCVRDFLGWPVALFLQFDSPDAGLQWYRATRVNQSACIAASEVSLPSDARIVDRRRSAPADDDRQ